MGNLIAPNGMGAYTSEPDRVWLWDEDEKEWVPPRRIVEYVDWRLTPDWLKEPRLVREKAEELGVTTETMYRWRKDKRFKEYEAKRAAELNEDVADTQAILSALKEHAKIPGNVKSQELWLKFRGAFPKETKTLEVKAEARDMSNPELIAQLKQQLAALEAMEEPRALNS